MRLRLRTLAFSLLALAVSPLAHAHAGLDAQTVEATRRIAAYPSDARAWLRRAELFRIQKVWPAADHDYDEALRLDPSLDVVDLCRGRMLLESGRAQAALAPLDRFVAAHPKHVEARVARARARRAAGQARAAVGDWDAAIAAASDEDARPEYYLERAECVLAASPRDLGRAVSGLIDGYRRLQGAASLAVRIHGLDPSRRLPAIAPPREIVARGIVVESAAVTRGPYLQRGTPTSIVVRWRTSETTDGVVRFGFDPAALNRTAREGSITTEHVVSLVGLAPDKRYYYSIGSSQETLACGPGECSFVTAPPPGRTKPFRVWVVGDSGTADTNAAAVRDAYAAFTGSRPTDFWMMLGDNAYQDGTDVEYQRAVFDMYPEMLRRSVLWPTFGNHDGHSADAASELGPYFDIFTLPRGGEAGGAPSGTEAYYAFDYGNVHFVCLDSYQSSRSPSGAMLTWLEADLAQTRKDWIVAFWHHPPYTKGSHDSDTETELVDMRQNANPILEAHGVDLVLTGHSHSYERSYLIDGHYGVSSTFSFAADAKDAGSGDPAGDGAYEKPRLGSDPHEGAVYVVAGSSGQTSGGALNHPAMYVSLNLLGSMVLDFDDDRLDAIFLDATGTVRDRFSVVKQPLPHPPER